MSKFTQEDLLDQMGLRIGDRVRVFGHGIYKVINTELDGICLVLENSEAHQWGEEPDDLGIEWLIGYEYSVITPPKYTLTETEKHIVLAIDEKWKWIARDMENSVVALYLVKPTKTSTYWEDIKDWSGYCSLDAFPNHFQFIQWSDEEPVSLDELRGIAKK